MSQLRSWGGQCWIQIIICVVPFEGPLHLQLQSHLCLTLHYVGGQLGIKIQLQIHIYVVPFEHPLHLQLQSHVCLTLDLVGQSFSVPTLLHYLHKWTFHPIFLFYLNIICSCVYISHNFYFSSAIFIALNDHLELTVLCRHSLLQRLTWYMFLLTIIGQFHLLLWTPFFYLFHVYGRYL